jgi:hypothetical protein
MIKKLMIIGAIFISANSHAENIPNSNVFVQALINSEATAPVPKQQQFEQAIQSLQAQTQDTGPILIQAKRLLRFKEQVQCGRIKFWFIQPSSGKSWPMGGQLNICENGQPPLRMCKDKPGFLISPNGHCPDRSEPQDTLEVAQAIKDALAKGDLSQEQVSQITKEQKAKKGAGK